MNEYTIGYSFCAGLVGLAGASALYMAGGRNNKGIRRFGASFVSAATICGVCAMLGVFSWWLLILYPLKIGEYIQGYSADRGMPAWAKRGLIALTSVVAGIVMCIILGTGWPILFLHTYLGAVTMTFAFKNPIAASAEEPLICLLNNLPLLVYPFATLI